MGLSSFTSAHRATKKLYSVRWCVVVIQDHSKPSKLVPVESTLCDFLLVFHCNHMPIFYRFRDITIYWSKLSFVSP